MISAGVVVAFLAAITLLSGLAARSGTPYPVVLVLGGFAMGLIPGIPSPVLKPDLVLVLFLPPLLYSAAFLSPVQQLRVNAVPILELAVGLVLATVGAVAAVGALAVGLPWSVAFVLGAVVGPTDPVSASAILQRLGAPDRIVTILEGESLVNDATAITAYTIAIAAVETGHFSASHAVGTFVFEVVAGTAVGLLVAWLAVLLRRGFVDVGVQLAFTLLTPYVAYVSAGAIGGSGVLAVVAAGLYPSLRPLERGPAQTRLELSSFWRLFVFLLNAILFLLIGVQLPHVLDGIGGGVSLRLAWHGLALVAVVVALRFAWMFVVPFVASALGRGEGAEAAPSTPAKIVLGWSGMRGAVSLAIALAIPLRTHAGHPFPHRAEVVFFAYAIVILTLVPPGFTLGPLIRRLGLEEPGARLRQAAEARRRMLHAALEEIESRAADGELDDSAADRLRGVYEARLDRLADQSDGSRADPDAAARYIAVRRGIIAAQREELGSLRASRAFPSEVVRRLEHELDLEEARLSGRRRS